MFLKFIFASLPEASSNWVPCFQSQISQSLLPSQLEQSTTKPSSSSPPHRMRASSLDEPLQDLLAPPPSHRLLLAVLHVTRTTLNGLEFLHAPTSYRHSRFPPGLASAFSDLSSRFGVGVLPPPGNILSLLSLTLTFQPSLAWVLALCASPPFN